MILILGGNWGRPTFMFFLLVLVVEIQILSELREKPGGRWGGGHVKHAFD